MIQLNRTIFWRDKSLDTGGDKKRRLFRARGDSLTYYFAQPSHHPFPLMNGQDDKVHIMDFEILETSLNWIVAGGDNLARIDP